MRYILLRSLQILSLIILFSGLVWGIRDNNVALELNSLIISSLIFYFSNSLLGKK